MKPFLPMTPVLHQRSISPHNHSPTTPLQSQETWFRMHRRRRNANVELMQRNLTLFVILIDYEPNIICKFSNVSDKTLSAASEAQFSNVENVRLDLNHLPRDRGTNVWIIPEELH